MVINIKKNRHQIEMCTIFAAIILSMNGIRYMLNVQESNIVFYLIYIIIIPVTFMENRFLFNLKIKKGNIIIDFFLVAMVLMSIITGAFNGVNALFNSFKLLLLIVDTWVINCFTKNQIKKTIRYLYVIVFLYVLFLVINPDRINVYLSKGSNYLVLTLPLGLVCTMILTRIVFEVYNQYQINHIFVECIFAILLFFALTKFTARSSILFPILVVIIVMIILGRKHIFKLMAFLAIFVVLVWLGYNYFVQNADPYIVNRMLSLFHDNKSEDRWEIWKECIHCIYKNKWFLMGGGTGAFELRTGFYPHNLFLQCIGEFGIFGLINCVYFTFCCIKNAIWAIQNSNLISSGDKLIICEVGSGLLYLFFTFMKSFQLYDAGILFIFITMLFKLIKQTKTEL